MTADIADRCRAYIAERTALPAAAIDAVLRAQEEFWQQYPALCEAATRLIQDTED